MYPLHSLLDLNGKFMKKIKSIIFTYSIILLFILCGCNSKNLGDKLTIFEGDRLEDRVIVYCTGYSFGSCKAGIYVVPTYEKHYDEKGNYAEYVETAKSNEKWIIAKTIQINDNKENYWIISKDFSLENVDCNKVSCDSIIQSHVTGALNYQEFTAKTKELGINLKFEK